MGDRPIIFSAPMVRALLDGRKTQTRRLATSPLRRVEAGDRLYVREAWHVRGRYTDVVEVGYSASRNRSHTEYVEQFPVAVAVPGKGKWPTFPKSGPSIHMPRWASRLTLIVEEVRLQPLNNIGDDDAKAEGVTFLAPTEEDREWARGYAEEYGCEPELHGVWIVDGIDCGWGKKPRQHMWGSTPSSMFQFLWNSLHTKDGERWQDNPEIVALTFSVAHGNIDRLPA